MRILPRVILGALVVLASACSGGGGGGVGELTLTASTAEIFQTETVTFTITVENAPGSNLVLDLDSSNPGILDVPATATIAGGATSAQFEGTGILSGGPVQITVSFGNEPNTQVTVLDPPEITLVAVTTSADQLSAGTLRWNGTATHARALDAANATVETLASGLTLGAPVLTGDESAFTLEVSYTLAVDTLPGPTTIVVDANGDFVGGDETTSLNVVRIPRVLNVQPATATLDTTEVRSFTVNLDQAARNGGETVALSASDTTKLGVQAMVMVSAGTIAATVPVTGTATGGPIVLAASLADSTRQSAVNVANAIAVVQNVTGNAAYQSETVSVMVTGTGSSYVAINAATFTVTEPAGLTVTNEMLSGTHTGWTLTFDVLVDSAAPSGTVQIAVDANGGVPGATSNVPFTIREVPRVMSVGPDGTSVDAGQSATMSLLLTAPARTGGESVMLSSTSASITFSSPVTVASGTSSATFSVTGLLEGSADLTASLNGGSDTTRIRVDLPQQGDFVVSEVLSLGTNGEAIEIHNTTAGSREVNAWFVQVGTGGLETIRSASDPTNPLTFVTVTTGGFAWGVPNPTNASDIPPGAHFVFGDPGTATTIADAGDRIRLYSTTTTLQDEVDMRGVFVSNGATPLGASTFPGHPGRTTQIRSSLAGSTLKDQNDDGGNWCVTFRAANTLGTLNQTCSEVVINEVLYDATGADDGNVFVELAGGGGTFIGSFVLRHFNQLGVVQNNAIMIAVGSRMPSDGFWVLADLHNTNVVTTIPNADRTDLAFDPQNGGGAASGGDGVQLLNASGMVADVVQYDSGGPATLGDGTAAIEGTFAAAVASGSSLARSSSSTDTNANSADFSAKAPSPGVPNP